MSPWNRLLVIGLALLAGVTRPTLADEPAAKPTTRILLLAKDRDHPPRTHEYRHECEVLAKCLRQTQGVEAIVSDGWPRDPKQLEGIDAIVLYTANGGDVLFGPEHRAEAEALLKRGVGLVAVHWSTGANTPEAQAAQLQHLGGVFGTGFSKYTVVQTPLTQAGPKHPIHQGWQTFPMRDEYYFDLKFQDAIQPVFAAEVEGQTRTVGWVFERPESNGGRSFGTVCGHFHDDVWTDARFRRAIVNGILWAAKRPVPEAGAPVDLTVEDLTLPPDPREAAK